LRVTIQQIGGTATKEVPQLLNRKAAVKAVTIDDNGQMTKLLEPVREQTVKEAHVAEDSWTNFYRRDDWSATALFYLDRPENPLSALADVTKRTEAIPAK
jgi:hypothetical protein